MASPPQSWAATAPGNHAEANDSADAPGTRELGWSSCHLKYLKLPPHHFGALVSSCMILNLFIRNNLSPRIFWLSWDWKFLKADLVEQFGWKEVLAI